jgi:hypothetical protein
VVRAPAFDRALDVTPSLEIAAERASYQLWYLVVGRESQADQLVGRQIVNAPAQVGWENTLEADALLETNDAILRAERHVPGEDYADQQCERHQESPTIADARVAGKPDHYYYDVTDQHRNSEEMPRRDPPTVCTQLLRLLCHPSSFGLMRCQLAEVSSR